MAASILVDAGPLVAWLVRDDEHHGWACDQFARLPGPLLTCEPVLTEASLLIQYQGGDPAAIPELVRRGVLKVAFEIETETGPLITLLRKYRDLPMSLADACLVRLSEICPQSTVLTVDSDFLVYRRQGRLVIPTLMPSRR